MTAPKATYTRLAFSAMLRMIAPPLEMITIFHAGDTSSTLSTPNASYGLDAGKSREIAAFLERLTPGEQRPQDLAGLLDYLIEIAASEIRERVELMADAIMSGVVKLRLRWYQEAAIDAVYNYLRTRDGNPCIVLPTGAGKTPVIATICRDAVQRWGGRVLVLAHVRELLEQSYGTLLQMAPDLDIGLYSAGLNRRETQAAVIVAGIQSVYARTADLGRFDLVLIDEAHLIPTDGDGMYRTLIADLTLINPDIRIIGLTATPYRMKDGMICGPENILHDICYEVGVRQLIEEGYLSRLRSREGADTPDTSGLHIRAGEYIESEVAAIYEDAGLVRTSCEEIVRLTADRKSVLIFCASIAHAMQTAAAIEMAYSGTGDRGGEDPSVAVITGDTDSEERTRILNDFRAGELKFLCNVNVLTTGFDARNVDCVVLLRPMASPGLYYQTVGRGFRLHPGKTDCLVLDYGGNILRHGAVDSITVREPKKGQRPEISGEPQKKCPACQALVPASLTVCDCGHTFTRPQSVGHDATASSAAILSTDKDPTTTTLDVVDIVYSVHRKRGQPDATPTLRVDYLCVGQVSEWVCFEHTGFARKKAEKWWRERSAAPVPATVAEAVRLCNSGAVAAAKTIDVKDTPGERFPRIVGYDLAKIPVYDPDRVTPQNPDAEDPFAPMVSEDQTKATARGEVRYDPNYNPFESDDIPF